MGAGWGRRSLVLLAVCAGACSSAQPGHPTPAPPAPSTDREAQADWAIGALDPCALASHVDGHTGPAQPYSPRSCRIALTGNRAVTVQVGDSISHRTRSRAVPQTENGLRTYRTYQPGHGDVSPTCAEAIPISFSRAIWILTEPTTGATQDSQCATTGRAAENVAALLRDPAGATATYSPTSAARWDMCRLRDAAFGRPNPSQTRAFPDLIVAGSPNADQCPDGAPADPSALGLWLRIGPDPVTTMANNPGAQRIQLGGVTAVEYPGDPICAVSWIQDHLATGANLVLTVRSPNGRCIGAEQFAKLTATLAAPPPLPAAPARLGFAPDQPDEVTDPACRIVAELPDGCRAPKPVTVPHGPAEVLRAAGEQGQDISCAILADALRTVTGAEPQVAYSKDNCLGVTPDRSISLELALKDYVPNDVFVGAPPPVTVAGYPAIDGGNHSSFRDLEISPYRDLAKHGDLHLLGSFEPVLGQVYGNSSTTDAAQLAIVDRIAESALRTYFQ